MDHARHTPPQVIPLERLNEVEHRIEILHAIRLLLHQQPGLNQEEDDPADILRLQDPPVGQYRSGHESELIKGKLTAAARKLLTRDMTALRPPLLAILERGEHEEVRPLVKAGVQGANTLEKLVSSVVVRHSL